MTGILFFRPVISAKGLNEISIHIQKINYIREGGGSLPESKPSPSKIHSILSCYLFWVPLYEDRSVRAIKKKINNSAIFLYESSLVLYNGMVQVLVNALNSQTWPNCGSIEKFSTVSCVVCWPFLEGSTNLTGP